MPEKRKLPLSVDGGKWNTGHVQGITLDTAGKYVYYSFTTVLVKTDLDGKLIGTVEGLLGHLGCIDFNDADGRVYGSLELKHDAIGKGIMKNTGVDIAEEDAFYIAVFDVDKINRVGMNAERDGVMTAVYLGEVAGDYNATDENGLPHRYGCSGIDGTAFGPPFGQPKGSPEMLYIAYGIYGEPEREDNDHQVLLCYDWRGFRNYAMPLIQGHPHHSGPAPDAKYFLYTGNTTWGIQNLEYDAFTGDWLASVYVGKKPQFPNYPMFVIDGSKPPCEGELKGRGGERGLLLTLKEEGALHEQSGVWGISFNKGQTGMYSFGDGLFYISHNGRTPEPERLHTCVIKLYRRLPGDTVGFELVEQQTEPIPASSVSQTPPPAVAASVKPTASNDTAPVLRIRNLSKRLSGRPILNNICLDVMPGEIFGFLGPNGSGKTTTIKLMLGLLKIEYGDIFICGHNIATDFEEAVANVGGIIENPEMYPYLTGRQNLEQYRRMYKNIPYERIDEVVRLVGLEARINDKISKYSLGMRQRLGVAQALLNHPRLLVLDEPTNGLDPAGIKDLRDILKALAANEGVAVFVSSHLLAELDQLCDRVGVIDRGMLVGIRAMEELHHAGDVGVTVCGITVLDREAAERVLASSGVSYSATANGFTVTVRDEALPALIKSLALADAGLTSVVPAKRTLEDAFLEMTRGYSAPQNSADAAVQPSGAAPEDNTYIPPDTQNGKGGN